MAEEPTELTLLADEWQFHLKAENRSSQTIRAYTDAVRLLDGFVTAQGIALVRDIDRRVIEKWLISMTERGNAPKSVSTRFWGAKAFFRWLADDEIIVVNPFDKLKEPQGEDRPPAVPKDEDVRRMLAAINGKTFTDRRDLALLRLMFDTGCRISEIIGLRVDDVDTRECAATVYGKGNRVRTVAFGAKTGAALLAYLRERRRNSGANRPELFINKRGEPLTYNGAYRISRERAQAVGLTFHPHQSRHWFAHNWLATGNNESDLMALGGWKSHAVMQRYGRSVRAERAREAHRRAAPGDRL